MMNQYSPAWDHGEIKEVFPNLYVVTGTNKTVHEGVELQHSCNMVIVKQADELTLINTVRLKGEGLNALDRLGRVSHVMRIGAFHGRHDAFYIDRYSAKLWALKGMQHDHAKTADVELIVNGKMPFADCSLFVFETSMQPEGILHINREEGILISCDSIKNWTKQDAFFSDETAKLYQKLGFIGTATISQMWLQACKVQAQDFKQLLALPFKHLISAHGEPLFQVAHEQLALSIQQACEA